MSDKGAQRSATIRVTVEVDEKEVGDFTTNEVARTEVKEQVILSDGGQPFAPVDAAVHALTSEAINKTTAQVSAYELLAKARAEAA